MTQEVEVENEKKRRFIVRQNTVAAFRVEKDKNLSLESPWDRIDIIKVDPFVI